ncbi:carboxymuconolactone decarboxylase family protein [uncultured Megasphaera sp.]|nr:carboxymuconolactone decarboxylase family protein [uncultured Megasphaera sp.]
MLTAISTVKKNGVTKEEMAEIITQLGFYSGWPKAWAAFNYAKEIYGE